MDAGAFNLPEVVCAVLQHVDHPRTLAACARVNTFWHREAEKLLWHGADHSDAPASSVWETPDLGTLQRLSQNAEKLRHWIGLIRHLDILFGEDFNTAVDGSLWQKHLWKDARFVSARVDIGSFNMSEERMAMLLQPNLRCLMLFGTRSLRKG